MAHLRGVGLNKQSHMLFNLLNERDREGGKAWDEKVLAHSHELKPRKRLIRYGRRQGSPSPEPDGEDEVDSMLFDPPPESKLMPREKPELPARIRRKNLGSVTACYMPKYKREDDGFGEKAIEYSLATGFNIDKVRKLHREFLQFARPALPVGVQHDPEITPQLDQVAFSKLMIKHDVHDKVITNRLFHIHDKDREGKITFAEYIEIMAVFKSENRRVQANTLFQMCDVDGDNRIGKLEFLKFINQGIDKDNRIVVSAILDELMDTMGCESVGEISKTIFVDTVECDEEAWSLLRALSPFTRMIKAAGGEVELQRTIK